MRSLKMIKLIFNNNEKLVGEIFGCIILFSICLGIIISWYITVIAILSYLFGLGLCCCLIRYQEIFIQYIDQISRLYYTHVSAVKKPATSCEICRKVTCNRHEVIINNPWKNLFITTKLNCAVEKLFTKIISVFILSWYTQVSKDKLFLQELQRCLKYASATIVTRVLRIDIFNLISTKIMPHIIQHIDDVICMQQIVKLKEMQVRQVMPDYLKSRLHIAITNRKNEIDYLRQLAFCLLPVILPVDNLKCKNFTILIREILSGWVLLPLMDVLADPDMINSLIILLTSHKLKNNLLNSSQMEYVEFLHHFSSTNSNNSKFAFDLKTIFKNTDLLYAYMQFLKMGGQVHILQFCLDVESFHNKLLTPEMTKKQLENLHSEAEKLYEAYFNQDSANFIGCSSQIQHKFHHLLEEGVYNVAKLQTSEPLYQAYDYAFNILEKEWLPLFFHSNQFYGYLCGCKVRATYQASCNKAKKMSDATTQGAVSKISSKLGRIKGVLKPSGPIEGAIYCPGFQIYCNESAAFVEDIFLSDHENIFRDLSTWTISIPSVESQQFSSSKTTYIFNIYIERVGLLLENEIKGWHVLRRDQDFYTLITKLLEFHGENEIGESLLPSRSTGITLENKQAYYESFLKSLLRKPSLRGSDLLYTFLTTDHDFTLLVNTAVPVVEDLGNIYHSVAFKFRKEKGQHLDFFLSTFLHTTVKSKQNKFEWAEMSDESDFFVPCNINITPATYTNHVYGDNCGIAEKKLENYTSPLLYSGVYHTIYYLLKYTLKVRPFIFKMYAAVYSLFPMAVELITTYYIEYKLRKLLTQDNIADFVFLLEGTIFGSHVVSTDDEKHKKKNQALINLKRISLLAETTLGTEFMKKYTDLFDVLQEPLFNKQLAYGLLDIVLSEVCQECNLKVIKIA